MKKTIQIIDDIECVDITNSIGAYTPPIKRKKYANISQKFILALPPRMNVNLIAAICFLSSVNGGQGSWFKLSNIVLKDWGVSRGVKYSGIRALEGANLVESKSNGYGRAISIRIVAA
ncbi:MAG: hypothetical protein PF442_07865 [Desulfobulbaceae bacterium]|nr:hypothetical protein [Desulfobulbaceae bacterium]